MYRKVISGGAFVCCLTERERQTGGGGERSACQPGYNIF